MKNIFLLCSIIVLLSASCGNSNRSAKVSTQSFEFTVNATGNTMSDMTFDTKELKVTEGSQVKINLVNKGTDGAMLHNLVIVKEGSEKEVAMEGLDHKDHDYVNKANANVIAASAITQPGTVVSFQFTAPAAGTYTYICTYPGHWMRMQGKLIVE